MRDSYAGGVSTQTFENRSRSHKLEISDRGTKLTIDEKHKFDLRGGKKFIVIDADGLPRLEKRRRAVRRGR